ncbi:MAG: dihydropteroate synthase [Propionicimonas sp.]
MGILNVTPDSFSDGGEYLDVEAAVAHGLALHTEGADIVDVGGESTRPGARRADPGTERDRVVPVVERLTAAGVPVSVDTMRAEVAMAAVAAGAVLVNDVSGGLADPDMLAAVAGVDAGYVAMHWRGHSDRMADLATYADVVAEVCAELADRLAAALAAGVEKERIILDPGLGFAKTAEHNWALLRRLDALAALGRPLLIGASRKRFLGELLAGEDGPRPVREREDAGVAITALAAAQHVWGVRTHTARPHRDAIAAALRLGAREGFGAG